MFSHNFATKGQMEVCSICPIFDSFQLPQNDGDQNYLKYEKQAIDVLGC